MYCGNCEMIDSKEATNDIVFRDIDEGDFQQIKELHLECFPIQYEDIFFQNACNGKGFKNSPLYAKVAVDLESSRIVGCILGQFVNVKKCGDQGLFNELRESPRDVFYILTLGLRQQYRRSGVGTMLLSDSLKYAKNNKSCGAVYLHVIHWNQPAIRFYERNSFIFFRELDEFYTIDKRHHSAYLYTLYINGFEAPLLTRMYLNARIVTRSSFTFIFAWINSLIPHMRGTVSSVSPNNNTDSFTNPVDSVST